MSVVGKAARVGKNIPKYPGKDTLEAAIGPLLGPLSQRVAGSHVQRLLGYWVMWNAFGGRQQLIDQGVLSRARAYANEKEFREVFGCDVSELEVSRVFGATLGG